MHTNTVHSGRWTLIHIHIERIEWKIVFDKCEARRLHFKRIPAWIFPKILYYIENERKDKL